ncbi:MAG: tRNA guanosine(15) transglycosylase TgtA, partial [Candidatus Thermoplasmatota archaeon]
ARFGAQAVITNAYILHRSLRERALAEGVHGVLDFDGPVMTDSGAFQQHVYGGVAVSNEDIVAFQRDIRSDVGTSLDRFSEPEHGPERARADVEETLVRTRAAAGIRGDLLLAGTVQGSLFPDLRRHCAEELSKIDVAVHAIGGVVPLMETYRFRDLVRVIVAAKQGLRPDRPVHLFGAGHPMIFGLAALLGCDMFDSASYHKYARDGRLLFADGTRHVEELREVPCECPACSAAKLEDLKADERLRAEHNLYASFAELRRVRQAIADGRLWERVERRCRSHPALLEALRELRQHNEFLERYEPLSRRGGFYFTGPETQHRPILWRYRKRLQERYRPPKRLLVMFPEGSRPYATAHREVMARVLASRDVHFLVKSVWGPVPIELDEMHPIGQSLVPDALD